MEDVLEFNPARIKLKSPFLRKKGKQTSKENNKISCLLALPPQQQHEQPVQDIVVQPPRLPPQLETQQKQEGDEPDEKRIDRELIRKKSQLISLNLKYIELQERYTSLLEKSQNNSFTADPDLEQISSVLDKRSQIEQQRLGKLTLIRQRLANIDFSSFYNLTRKKAARSSSSLK